MPELPEVETIRRDLEREVGRQEDQVGRGAPARSRSRAARPKKAFTATLEGDEDHRRSTRQGKYLLLKLDSGDMLVVHLRMSGQLLRAGGQGRRSPSTPTW